MKTMKQRWEQSYNRDENYTLYPKEEVVKFLSYFVRKRTGLNTFINRENFSNKIKGLDYGCGIGRNAILLHEFGIDAYGVDIAANAIMMAKKLARHLGFKKMADKFFVIDGKTLPYEDDAFDITISIDVLYDIPFDTAKKILKELARVTKRLIFINLVSGDNHMFYREFDGETEQKTDKKGDTHEKGIIRSYYNWSKIEKLVEGTGLSIKWCRLATLELVTGRYKHGLYYIVLEKNGKKQGEGKDAK